MSKKKDWKSYTLKELEKMAEGKSLQISVELTQSDLDRIYLFLSYFEFRDLSDTDEEAEQGQASVEKLKDQLSDYLTPID